MFPIRRRNSDAHGIADTAHARGWHRLGMALLEILFPSRCHACGNFFRPPHNRLPMPARPPEESGPRGGQCLAGVLCPACISDIVPVTSPLCCQCGQVFRSRQGDDHLCAACIIAPKRFTRARAAGVYDGPLKILIQRLKYGGELMLAGPLSDLLFTAFGQYWDPNTVDLILPVPLHTRRMRQRGFNQAWLLIQNWPGRIRSTTRQGTTIGFRRQLLRRIRPTTPQTGLDRRHRRTNLTHAFAVTNPGEIAGKRVLVVDDVYTTGATANACARVLMTAGADQVDILSVARTL